METQVKQYIRQFHSVHLADIKIKTMHQMDMQMNYHVGPMGSNAGMISNFAKLVMYNFAKDFDRMLLQLLYILNTLLNY